MRAARAAHPRAGPWCLALAAALAARPGSPGRPRALAAAARGPSAGPGSPRAGARRRCSEGSSGCPRALAAVPSARRAAPGLLGRAARPGSSSRAGAARRRCVRGAGSPPVALASRPDPAAAPGWGPDDGPGQRDIQEGGREVGFSKYGHLTYEEALEQNPSFCDWVLRESQRGDASERLNEFARWLEGQGLSLLSAGQVGFGKYEHLTYEEALDQQPGFCDGVLRESLREDASERLKEFARWLQEHGGSLLSARRVGFCKYAHLTYEEALEQKPSFCDWVLRESQGGDASDRLMDFARWLQKQGFSPFGAGQVGFGKHARLTYEEALDQQPGYCDWVLQAGKREDASERLKGFARWLRERLVEHPEASLAS